MAEETIYRTTSLLDLMALPQEQIDAHFVEGDWQIYDFTFSQPIAADTVKWIYDEITKHRLLEWDGPNGVRVSTEQQEDGYHLRVELEKRVTFLAVVLAGFILASLIVVYFVAVEVRKWTKELGPIPISLGAGAIIGVAAAVLVVVLVTKA